jgi:hypothetical protein
MKLWAMTLAVSTVWAAAHHRQYRITGLAGLTIAGGILGFCAARWRGSRHVLLQMPMTFEANKLSVGDQSKTKAFGPEDRQISLHAPMFRQLRDISFDDVTAVEAITKAGDVIVFAKGDPDLDAVEDKATSGSAIVLANSDDGADVQGFPSRNRLAAFFLGSVHLEDLMSTETGDQVGYKIWEGWR